MREPGTVQKYGIGDGGMMYMVVKNPRSVCIDITTVFFLKNVTLLNNIWCITTF